MSLQDHNAGNAGDQLKHALLGEALASLSRQSSPSWGYVETHAGAGAYATPHAATLFPAAWRALEEEPLDGAGRCYAELLSGWWRTRSSTPGLPPDRASSAATTATLYPGSAAQALSSGAMRGPVRLCEADASVAARLRAQVDRCLQHEGTVSHDGWPGPGARVQIRVGPFDQHLDLLAVAQQLLVLVDPYYYDRGAVDCAAGRLGQEHLRRICRRLQERDAVLLGFASSPPSGRLAVGEAGGLVRGTWPELAADLRLLQPPALRCWRALDTPHALLAAGWGAGKAIVRGLPGATAWKHSWLARPPLSLAIVEEPGR